MLHDDKHLVPLLKEHGLFDKWNAPIVEGKRAQDKHKKSVMAELAPLIWDDGYRGIPFNGGREKAERELNESHRQHLGRTPEMREWCDRWWTWRECVSQHKKVRAVANKIKRAEHKVEADKTRIALKEAGLGNALNDFFNDEMRGDSIMVWDILLRQWAENAPPPEKFVKDGKLRPPRVSWRFTLTDDPKSRLLVKPIFSRNMFKVNRWVDSLDVSLPSREEIEQGAILLYNHFEYVATRDRVSLHFVDTAPGNAERVLTEWSLSMTSLEVEREAIARIEQINEDLEGVLATADVDFCCFCGKGLTVPGSKEAGYGPDCAQLYGLKWTYATQDASEATGKGA